MTPATITEDDLDTEFLTATNAPAGDDDSTDGGDDDSTDGGDDGGTDGGDDDAAPPS